MFKRVEKRLKRKQREDELGLDGEMKEILGLNDTDSDESDSDANSDDGSSEGDFPQDEEGEDMELHYEADEDPDSDAGENEDERALITVSEALHDPVFIVSLDPDIKECIICPGKQLKGTIMAEKHKSSNACMLSLSSNSCAQLTRLLLVQAHERRFKQFQRLASSTVPNAKVQELLLKAPKEWHPQTSAPSGISKRAEKKRVAQEKRKVKREKFKARQKAKKETLVSSATIEPEKTESRQNVKIVRGEQAEKAVVEGKEKGKPMGRSGKAVTSAPTEFIDATKVKKRHSESTTEPPKKKRKTSTSSTVPTTKKGSNTITPPSIDKPVKSKSKPKLTSEPDESPVIIQELQSQVRDIIESASSLAKAARTRALNGGGDSGDEEEKLPAKKRKATHTKMKKVQKS